MTFSKRYRIRISEGGEGNKSRNTKADDQSRTLNIYLKFCSNEIGIFLVFLVSTEDIYRYEDNCSLKNIVTVR